MNFGIVNVEIIKSSLDHKYLQYFAGRMTDNCNTAVIEVQLTFDYINGSLEPEEQLANGVPRQSIQMGYPYHHDNLATNAAVNGAFGAMESEDNQQIHHR